MARGWCCVSDCLNLAEAGGLCAAHRKRLSRGSALSPAVRETGLTGFERVLVVINEMVDDRYDGPRGEGRWRARLRWACRAWLGLSGPNNRKRRRQERTGQRA